MTERKPASKKRRAKKPAAKKRRPAKKAARQIAAPTTDHGQDEKPKNRGGRPSFKPTDEERRMVQTASGLGIPQEQIAILVRDGIHPETLRDHFRSKLDRGIAGANLKVMESLYSLAIGRTKVVEIDAAGNQTVRQDAVKPDVAAVIFWAKTRLGMKEGSKLELTGRDGTPLFGGIDPKKLSDEELATLEHLFAKASIAD